MSKKSELEILHYDGTKEQLEGNFKGFLTNFKGMEIICKDIEDHQISSLKSWRKYERKNEELGLWKDGKDYY